MITGNTLHKWNHGKHLILPVIRIKNNDVNLYLLSYPGKKAMSGETGIIHCGWQYKLVL